MKKKYQKCRVELLQFMDTTLNLPGNEDYIDENFGAALDIAHDRNSIIDLDCIVHLSKLLGFKVSYGLYCYIDRFYDESLLELSKDDLPELWIHIGNYAKGGDQNVT